MPDADARGEWNRTRIGSTGVRHWLGFGLFCLMSASAWLVEEAWPSLLPVEEREGLRYLAIALLAGIVCRGFAPGSHSMRARTELAVASVCLLGLPGMLIESMRGGASDGTIAGLLALLPTIVVLVAPHFNSGSAVDEGSSRLLAPALIGLAGTLFLLPFALPDSLWSVLSDAAVVVAVCVAATASVWMYRLLRTFQIAEAVAICCLANAVFLIVVLLARRGMSSLNSTSNWAGASLHELAVEMLKAVSFDLPQIVLLVWLMREVSPVRFAARSLLIPLLTVVEGYALLRSEISVRAVCGAGLMLFGSWRLLAGGGREEEPGMMLR